MKLSNLLAVGFIGWFFMFRQELPPEKGTRILSEVGPFATQLACIVELEDLIIKMKAAGYQLEYRDCIEVQGA